MKKYNYGNIREAFKKHKTDKHYHHYEFIYKDILNSNPASLLEIGIKKGRSLCVWRDICRDICRDIDLYGMDITDEEWIPERIKFSRSKTFIADSTKKESVNLIPNLDVIIDDGSHDPKDQIVTLNNFADKFNKYYVIEDVTCNLLEILTQVEKLGFKYYSVFRSFDQRGKMKWLQSYALEHYGLDLEIPKDKEEKTVYIHSIIIRR